MSKSNIGDLNVKIIRWMTLLLAVGVLLVPGIMLYQGMQPRGKEPTPPPKKERPRPAPTREFQKIHPDEQVIILQPPPEALERLERARRNKGQN